MVGEGFIECPKLGKLKGDVDAGIEKLAFPANLLVMSRVRSNIFTKIRWSITGPSTLLLKGSPCTTNVELYTVSR